MLNETTPIRKKHVKKKRNSKYTLPHSHFQRPVPKKNARNFTANFMDIFRVCLRSPTNMKLSTPSKWMNIKRFIPFKVFMIFLFILFRLFKGFMLFMKLTSNHCHKVLIKTSTEPFLLFGINLHEKIQVNICTMICEPGFHLKSGLKSLCFSTCHALKR